MARYKYMTIASLEVTMNIPFKSNSEHLEKLVNSTLFIYYHVLRIQLMNECDTHLTLLLDNIIANMLTITDITTREELVASPTVAQEQRVLLDSLIHEVYSYTYDCLHICPWKDVNMEYKRAFALATILYVVIDTQRWTKDAESTENATEPVIGDKELCRYIKQCDMGLLLGGGSGPAIKILSSEFGARDMSTSLHHQLLELIDLLTEEMELLPLSDKGRDQLELDTVMEGPWQRYPQVESKSASSSGDVSAAAPSPMSTPSLSADGTGKRARASSPTGKSKSNTIRAEKRGRSDDSDGSGDRDLVIPTCGRTGVRLAAVPRVRAEDCSLDVFSRDYLYPQPGAHTSQGVDTVCNPSLNLQAWGVHGLPVVLLGAIDHWPAMQPNGKRSWTNLGYLRQTAGHRLAPIETGCTHYLATDSSQSFVTISEFIDTFICPGPSTVDTGNTGTKIRGYLAQHQLFEFIPALRKDICVPDYCILSTPIDDAFIRSGGTGTKRTENSHSDGVSGDTDDNSGGGYFEGEPIVQAWLGPVGTVSPLHHDPYHNLLCQVVGYKYVRLYNYQSNCIDKSGESGLEANTTGNTNRMYPREGVQYNNSQVDLLEECRCKGRSMGTRKKVRVESKSISKSESESESESDLCVDYCCCNHGTSMHFPLLKNATYIDTILGPGEVLFIPRHTWHYIIALDWDKAEYLRHSDINTRRTESTPPADPQGGKTGNSISNISGSPGSPKSEQFSFSVSFWWGPSIELE